MNPTISSGALDAFFAIAPWVVGAVIYLSFFVAKRRECATVPAVAMGGSAPTYACARCGRRGPLDQMMAQDHGGAVGYLCRNCGAAH